MPDHLVGHSLSNFRLGQLWVNSFTPTPEQPGDRNLEKKSSRIFVAKETKSLPEVYSVIGMKFILNSSLKLTKSTYDLY